MSKKFINELHLTNYKTHRKVAIKINGRHFICSGKNGTGKTSIMQAILRLLGRLPENLGLKDRDAITQGEESGQIKMFLGADGQEYRVEERYTKTGLSRVRFYRVTDGRSDELTPAVTRIKEIFGNVLDLTPLIDMAGKDQFEYLQRVFDLDVEGYKRVRAEKFETRTQVNARRNRLKAFTEAPETRVFAADKEMYQEPKRVEDILARRVDLSGLNQELQEAVNKRDTVVIVGQEIKSLEQQIKTLQDALAHKVSMHSKLVGELPDIGAIQQRRMAAEDENRKIDQELTQVVEFNRSVDKVRAFVEAEKDLAKVTKESEDLSKGIKDLDENLKLALTRIPFADICEGMELRYDLDDQGKVRDIGLYKNSLPFHRSVQSYGDMIQCLIKFSSTINPDGLNFIYLSYWNELDEDNQNGIIEFARLNENVQLGIEKVDNTSTVEIRFIES